MTTVVVTTEARKPKVMKKIALIYDWFAENLTTVDRVLVEDVVDRCALETGETKTMVRKMMSDFVNLTVLDIQTDEVMYSSGPLVPEMKAYVLALYAIDN